MIENIRFTKEQLLEGHTFTVDKPFEWTSFDVVNKIKSLAKYNLGIPKLKIGHAGTLDPLATGLLVICTGKNTKLIDGLQAEYKVYSGSFVLGATTPSYDLETGIDQEYPTEHITEASMHDAALSLTGLIKQIPPAFSAIKIGGKRVYKKARAGVSIEIPEREVEVFSFDIQIKDFPEIHFKVKCSKGTYIRSLVYDFGRQVGSGAYLKSLRRTHSGTFDVEEAWTVDELEEYMVSLNEIE
jgi:tRNA pseudouridine55 synthase